MIRRPPRSTLDRSSAASDVYKRQATIEEAIQKQTAVHLILSETSFTGDIIKYDQQRQQIIVKNFAKNVTRIIRISDIQRLRFVPSTVQTAQKNRFKKE